MPDLGVGGSAADYRPLVTGTSPTRADLLVLTRSRGTLPRLVSIAHDTSLMRSAQFPLAFPIPPALLALDSLVRNGLATCEGAPSPRRISFGGGAMPCPFIFARPSSG